MCIMAKILIAEHNNSIQTSLKQNLSGKGHELRFVEQDTDAWKQVATEAFDIIIIDLMMPDMDGFNLAQKALFNAPNTHVIFITGFAAVTMDTYNTPSYAPSPMTSRPFHIGKIADRIDFLMGHVALPLYALTEAEHDEDNVIYADFGS